jgi:hypothetical protein
MMMDVETFTARFTQALLRNSPTNTNYVLTSTLVSALKEAMRTPESPGYQFPLMMFLDGDPLEYRIVANAEEEAQAAAQGYRRTANPPNPAYPQMFVEVDLSRGTDYRRVHIRNAQEEETFKAVVDLTKWVRDDEYKLAGRGVSLESLVEERKTKLKQSIDKDGWLCCP